MNDSIACVFPDTLPDERLLFPLVQVFGQVVYMQAVENEPPEIGRSTHLVEQCRQQGRLKLLTPAPLGEQRERFLALVGDMKRRGVDYTSQLSMLTLAGLNRRNQMESKHSILANLLHRSDITGKEEGEMLLWQSRLVLKLGEFLDAEEAGLNEALRQITSRQDALLAELREEEDNPFALTASLRDAAPETGGVLRHRLKAWSQLCFQGSHPQASGIYITRHEAALDSMLESIEKNQHRSARLIASLELPAGPGPTSSEASALEPLIGQCPEMGTALIAMSGAAAPSLPEGELERLFQAGAADWSRSVAARYPAGSFERCSLELFFFPGISARQLFLECFCGDMHSSGDAHLQPAAGCCIGLLRMN